MIWFVGFYAPYWRDLNGKLTLRGIFGHCEIWGNNGDTWVFIDPKSDKTTVQVLHRYDDVRYALLARETLCHTILRAPEPRDFTMPIHGLISCAAICGSILGVRALLPSTLHRKLQAKGAKVIHGTTTDRPGS